MTGIKIKELYDFISNMHEIEFVYQNITYVIQPEQHHNDSYITIWKCDENPICICKLALQESKYISKTIIDNLLTIKCFNGKSFLDIQSDIKVEIIF